MLRKVVMVGVLLFASAASAAEPWHGRWGMTPEACKIDGDTSETAPLFANAKSVRWFVAHCQIRSATKIATGVRIKASCANEGHKVTIPIVLEPQGDVMRVTWEGGRVPDMRRCQ